ncbi:translation elongation factor Ts [Spiroplasma endosymbiont of Aspidapion aeneum]|uniref:translation elongation factor Ts n=1 Tax=Spiroplasma endosymbiont of Aspidapion aeneum TaxID=3066276 RepID=UPI00313B02A2
MAVNAKLVKELREITSAGMIDCKNALEASNDDIDKAIIWLRENGLSKAAKKADRIASEGIVLAKKEGNKVVILEVNSETDFVSKNEKFVKLINDIADCLLKQEPKDIESALKLKLTKNETIEQACVSATATIGEKISFRRFNIVTGGANDVVTLYNHSNSRVSTALLFSGKISPQDAYSVAMHTAAMGPKYISLDDVPKDFMDAEMHILKEQNKDNLVGKPENIVNKMMQGKLSKRLSEVTLLEQDFVLDEKQKVSAFIKSKGAKLDVMVRYEVGEGIEKQVVDFAEEVAAQLKGK